MWNFLFWSQKLYVPYFLSIFFRHTIFPPLQIQAQLSSVIHHAAHCNSNAHCVPIMHPIKVRVIEWEAKIIWVSWLERYLSYHIGVFYRKVVRNVGQNGHVESFCSVSHSVNNLTLILWQWSKLPKGRGTLSVLASVISIFTSAAGSVWPKHFAKQFEAASENMLFFHVLYLISTRKVL